jgi:hypothetical protein
LTFTNKAVEVVADKCSKYCERIKTLDSYMNDLKISKETIKNNIKSLDYVFIDEYSMVPNKFMQYIYLAWCKNNDIVVEFYSDANQCDSVDVFSYDYLQSESLHQMCPTVEKLTYIEELARYNSVGAILEVNQCELNCVG